MTWKKYFEPFEDNTRKRAGMSGQSSSRFIGGAGKFDSSLPQVYSGPPNRIERYSQYDHMDLDSQVSASLDIIAEFCTQLDDSSDLPFTIQFNEDLTPTEKNILQSSLKRWTNINKFKNRLYDIIRNTIKYGDSFFVRDPETYEWLYVFPSNIEKITVDEARGKRPDSYWVRDFDFNTISQTVSRNPIVHSGSYPAIPTHNGQQTAQSYYSRSANNNYSSASSSRFTSTRGSLEVGADHIVHLSMNNGLDPNFPFGTSILERVFKTFKQKELIEDSIIIYRIQRAPERRVFYIDVGDLPQNKAMQFVERMKNEIHQRRIPTKTNDGGNSIMDATYNPLSVLEDFFFPQSTEGRGSRVETLPGGDTRWGLDELQYFDNLLGRGLRIPVSYLPTGLEESAQPFTDGRVGTALIQELRFAKFCERIQNTFVDVFDHEFKMYLKFRDFNISSGSFNLVLNEPQDYAAWRKIEIDTSRISNFTSLIGSAPFISKRLAMMEYLGWDEGKINENNEMYIQENPSITKDTILAKYIEKSRSDTGLRDVGFSPSQYPNEGAESFELEGDEPDIPPPRRR